MSEPIAGDLMLAPSPARRRLLALAAALSGALGTAAIVAIAAIRHATTDVPVPVGLEGIAAAAVVACAYAGASRRRERTACRLLLVPTRDPSDAAMQPCAWAARAGAAWRRAATRPACITLVGARAVHVNPRRIVLRSTSGGAVVWRDALDAHAFRRLAVRARWARTDRGRY